MHLYLDLYLKLNLYLYLYLCVYLCLCCSKEEDQEVVPPTSTRKPDGASSSTAGCSVRVLQCLYALFKISFTICALSSMFDGRLYGLRFYCVCASFEIINRRVYCSCALLKMTFTLTETGISALVEPPEN